MFFILTAGLTSASVDTSRQSFSIGFGWIGTRHFLPPADNGYQLEQRLLNNGLYLDMNFRRDKVMVKVGAQILGRSYYVRSVSPQTGIIGISHSSDMWGCPIMLGYKVFDHKDVKIHALGGLVMTMTSEEVMVDYVMPPMRNRADYGKVYSYMVSGGLGVDWNLHKHDIWLNSRVQYMTETARVSSDGRAIERLNGFTCSLGLNIMLSNILYKDAVKTLNRYPQTKK